MTTPIGSEMPPLEENRLLQAIVDAFEGLIFISTQGHRITYMNRRLVERTGRSALGEECYRVVHGLDGPCPWCAEEEDAPGVVRREIFSPRDERWYLRTEVPFAPPGGERGKIVLLMDITEQKQTEEALRHRERFEALLTAISSRFVHLPHDKMDEAIGEALEELGRFFEVSRCVLFALDDEEVALTHEWCAAGVRRGEKRRISSIGELPWLQSQLRGLRPISVPSIARLPAEAAAEKALWRGRALQSFVAIPIAVGGEVFAILGLGCEERERLWDDRDIRLLGTVGVLFGNAFENQKMVKALRDLNEALEGHVAERTDAIQAANRALRQEIAERRRTAEELNKLSRAVEQSPVSILITDTRGRIEYVNPKFCTISGYSAEEAIGKTPGILRSEETPHRTYEELWRTIAAGGQWTGEFLNRRKNGERYWESATISPVRDADGHITHYLAVKEDITERKRLEQMLIEEKHELEAAQLELERAYAELKRTQSQMLQQEKMASIGQLAAGVAHEINNPMGFIASNLTSLQKYCGRLVDYSEQLGRLIEGSGSPELTAERDRLGRALKIGYISTDVPELIAESLEGADRVKKIVQALKSFSRPDDDVPVPVDVNACLENTLEVAWNELKYKVTVHKSYGEIPIISGYPHRLGQVFINLLLNAAHAIQQKGEIRIATFAQDSDVVVSISDTGCGIAPEHLPKIFEPFFTTKEVGQGTGLGLSICYEIIKNHNGTIRVESTVGEGTTFFLHLPA